MEQREEVDDILWTRETNPHAFAEPLAEGHVRINVPALFRKTYGRDAHPIADHARLVLFTNKLADFMNEQAYRWRHRLMTPKHLGQLREMLTTHARTLRDQGV